MLALVFVCVALQLSRTIRDCLFHQTVSSIKAHLELFFSLQCESIGTQTNNDWFEYVFTFISHQHFNLFIKTSSFAKKKYFASNLADNFIFLS